MKIAIGSDQVGYPLKHYIGQYLASLGMEVVDVGSHHPERPADYPDYAFQVDRQVVSGACERGILICGTGLGMSIAANKFPGIRAALVDDAFSAQLSRAHNDANVLCMGANVVTPARAEWIVRTWLETPFDGGRHVARVNKLDQEIASAVVSPPPELGLSWDRLAVAISPRETVFGPVLFAGRFEEGLQAAARAGFCNVEISLRAPDDPLVAGLDAQLAQAGLKLSAIATGQSCLHDELCLCSPDPGHCAQAVERLKAHIRLGKQLDAAVIVGGVRGKLAGTDTEKDNQRCQAIAAMQECAAFADGLGVQLLLEPINRYETDFICSVDEGLAVLEEVGAPNFKLLLDTFHMNIEETDIGMSLRRAGDRLGYVHFADSNRRAPGSGHIDFTHLLAVLTSIGYQGMISAEIFPLPDDLTALERAAAFFRTMIAVQKQ